MQNLQNIDVMSHQAGERGAELRRATLRVSRDRSQPRLRRRLGEALVRVGALVAAEPTHRPAGAGAR